jgi:hypothetical protein
MTGDRYDDLAANVAALADRYQRHGRDGAGAEWFTVARELRALLGGDTTALDARLADAWDEAKAACRSDSEMHAPHWLNAENPYRARAQEEPHDRHLHMPGLPRAAHAPADGIARAEADMTDTDAITEALAAALVRILGEPIPAFMGGRRGATRRAHAAHLAAALAPVVAQHVGDTLDPIRQLVEREIDLDVDEPDFEPGEGTWRFVRDLLPLLGMEGGTP